MNKAGLRDNCVLHHDNASSHTALIVFENLVKMGVETLLHPPYRPDSLPGNFFLFYGIKITRKGSQLKALRVVPVVHFLLEEGAVDIFAWSVSLSQVRTLRFERLTSTSIITKRLFKCIKSSNTATWATSKNYELLVTTSS
ncbi:UNVERIFIED_CONTAM: hypothetical protein NCL1_38104 [Trichonephila clavipes]